MVWGEGAKVAGFQEDEYYDRMDRAVTAIVSAMVAGPEALCGVDNPLTAELMTVLSYITADEELKRKCLERQEVLKTMPNAKLASVKELHRQERDAVLRWEEPEEENHNEENHNEENINEENLNEENNNKENNNEEIREINADDLALNTERRQNVNGNQAERHNINNRVDDVQANNINNLINVAAGGDHRNDILAGLSARYRGYLEKPEAFDMLAELFKTKKHMRIVNWNSGKYNAAREALDEFIAERDALQDYINEHMGEPDFQQGLEEHANRLAQKEEELSSRLVDYIGKVTKGDANEAGTKGILDMNQSSGAARLTGAKAILDAINENGHRFKDRMVNQNKGEGYVAAQNAEQVRETNFNEIFQKKYGKLKETGESGAHRRASKAAMERVEGHEVEKNVIGAGLRSAQEVNHDLATARRGGAVNRQA